jgi:bacillithiol biosynthesis deacetylase BshB1
MQKLDILAFGAHPDDVELGCGGTLLAAVAEGKKIGIIDLTQGELGTRGTVADRLKEALLAGEIIGAAVRENMGMKDGFFVNDQAHQMMIVEVIRKYQPDIVLCNAPEDRHPDHGKAAKLVADAAFLSGLVKIQTTHNRVAQEAWRPTQLFHYIQSRNLQPSFVVDISEQMDQKMAAILAHASQFYNPNSNEPNTFISSDSFLEFIKGRAKEFGQQVGVQYAEGFISEKMIGIHSFDGLIQKTT